MLTVAGLLNSIFEAPSTGKRVRAVATTIMWFAAGAYIASYLEGIVSAGASGATAEVVLESDDTEFTTFKAFCELQGKEDGKQKL